MNIIINGNYVSLEELERDVIAAKEHGFSNRFAFTPETVQSLIDVAKIMPELIEVLQAIVAYGAKPHLLNRAEEAIKKATS